MARTPSPPPRCRPVAVLVGAMGSVAPVCFLWTFSGSTSTRSARRCSGTIYRGSLIFEVTPLHRTCCAAVGIIVFFTPVCIVLCVCVCLFVCLVMEGCLHREQYGALFPNSYLFAISERTHGLSRYLERRSITRCLCLSLLLFRSVMAGSKRTRGVSFCSGSGALSAPIAWTTSIAPTSCSRSSRVGPL